MIQTKQILTGKLVAKQSLNGNINNAVVKLMPELKDLVATPSNEEQNFTGEYGNVKVNAIQGETLEITPSLEKQIFEGIYTKIIVKGADIGGGDTPSQENDVPVIDGLLLGLIGTKDNVFTSNGAIWLDKINSRAVNITNGSVDDDNSIIFDGTNTQFDSGISQSELVNGFTIVLRMNPTVWENYRGVYGIHGEGDGYSYTHGIVGLQYVDGLIYAGLYGENRSNANIILQPEQLPINEWSTYIFTYENNRVCVYINGELIGENDKFPTLKPYKNLILGKGHYLNDRYFKGNLSHCLVYNRALTQEEILKLTDYVLKT